MPKLTAAILLAAIAVSQPAAAATRGPAAALSLAGAQADPAPAGAPSDTGRQAAPVPGYQFIIGGMLLAIAGVVFAFTQQDGTPDSN